MNAIEVLRVIDNDMTLDDQERYELIFSHRSHEFCSCYRAATGNAFDWYDPDTDYAEDVRYFMDAVYEAQRMVFGNEQNDEF